MASFVRKNLLVLSGQFFVGGSDGDTDDLVPNQPSGVTAVLTYCNTQGVKTTTTLALTLQADGVTWSVTWDSSAAKAGRVDWMVYSYGAVVAAAEGTFRVLANCANKV